MNKSTLKMSGVTIFLLIVVSFFSCKKDKEEDGKDYKQEMRNFVQNISVYAKGINPNFAIIPQNGANLVSNNGDESGSPDMNYINAIDGIGQEDLFYGYDNDNQATSLDDNNYFRTFLDMAKNNGTVKIMVTDYCSTPTKMDDSYTQNNGLGYVSFAADHRDLDNIPSYPNPIYNENTDTITNLQDAKNFLYLINPDNNFATKQAFVDAVKSTNYDYIIMDYFYNGEEFTSSQIEQLKQKANGGKRLLICYMSIGEAENYRYYWKSDWKIGSPSFIVEENPNWAGNYVVKYWESEWQDVIFGNDNSYLKKILDAGFDGVYLDIIDAFEHFEE
jgi:cysteinyl-tRNA synthetase